MKEIQPVAGGPQIYLDDLHTLQQEALEAIQEQFKGSDAFILQGGEIEVGTGGHNITAGLCYINGKIARLHAQENLSLPQKIVLNEEHIEDRALQTGDTAKLYTHYEARLEAATDEECNQRVDPQFILLGTIDGNLHQGLRLTRIFQVGDKIGVGTDDPTAGLDVQPLMKATENNQALTALHITTRVNENNKTGLKKYGLIVEDGDVGIGTDSPEERLHVSGGRISLEGGASTYLSVKETGSAAESRFWTHTDGKLHIQNNEGIEFTNIGNSNPRMSITNNGNVGIGTDSPASKLHISSGASGDAVLIMEADTDNNNESDNPRIELRQDGGSTGAYFGFYDEAGGGWHPSNLLRIGTRYSNTDHWDVMVIRTDNGNVGIGTDSPVSKLEVSGGPLTINNQGDGAVLLDLNTERNWQFRQLGSGGVTALELASINGAGSKNFIINTSGKIGIGTTHPGNKLDVAGGIDIDDYIRHNGDSNTHIGFPANQTITLRTAGTDRMTVNSNGNVGIGTDSPASKLHISSGASGDAVLIMEADTDNNNESDNPRIELRQDGGNTGAYFGFYDEAGDGWQPSNLLRIGTRYSNTDHWDVMAIRTDNGNVGIGTTNPLSKLHVNGEYTMTNGGNEFRMWMDNKQLHFRIKNAHHGGNNSNRTIIWNGDNNWDLLSDKKLKTDIENEKNILDRLMKLNVKNYRWKDKPESKTKLLGFIAQDVKPLFPSLVGNFEDPETGESNLTLKYGNFGILAVGALKEFKLKTDKEIAQLKKKIQTLEKKMKM